MANMVTMQELEQYVLRATEVAKQAGCYFIDLWSEMHGQSNYTRFLHPKDGVHFNEQGYESGQCEVFNENQAPGQKKNIPVPKESGMSETG